MYMYSSPSSVKLYFHLMNYKLMLVNVKAGNIFDLQCNYFFRVTGGVLESWKKNIHPVFSLCFHIRTVYICRDMVHVFCCWLHLYVNYWYASSGSIFIEKNKPKNVAEIKFISPIERDSYICNWTFKNYNIAINIGYL